MFVEQFSILLFKFQVLDLQETIATLVMSLIEENGPGPSQVAKVCWTLI